MVNLIPAVNGTAEYDKEFIRPCKFTFLGGYPDIQAVFSERIGTHKEGDPCLVRFEEEPLKDGAYRITVDREGVTIVASGRTGYSNALTTLWQLFVFGEGQISVCKIEDCPRFSRRGIMLDVCRHFFTIDEVKKIVEQCSRVKLNVLHLHLSNDQGWRLQSTKYPILNEISSFRKLSAQDPLVVCGLAKEGEKYGGYYTKEEIRSLIAYAGARGVDVVPEIEMPGHSSAVLAAFPEFTCSGKPLGVKSTFGVHSRLWCVGNEEAYAFLYELIDEVAALFPSPYFHIGGDEAPKTEWKKCPKCQKLGLGNAERLQAHFINKIAAHLKEIGKTPIVWNDSAASGELDKSVVVQYWMEMGGDYMKEEVKGRKILFSNMNQFYADYSYAEIPLRATYLFEPNVIDFPVPEENVFGIESPLWTEWLVTPEDIEKKLYPRLLAVAECGWTTKKDLQDFLVRAKEFAESPVCSVLTALSWSEATVKGEEALKMIAQNMLALSEKYRSMKENDAEEEAGAVEAVEVEGAKKRSAEESTVAFMTDKMKAAYSEEEIKQVLRMMGEMRRKQS